MNALLRQTSLLFYSSFDEEKGHSVYRSCPDETRKETKMDTKHTGLHAIKEISRLMAELTTGVVDTMVRE